MNLTRQGHILLQLVAVICLCILQSGAVFGQEGCADIFSSQSHYNLPPQLRLSQQTWHQHWFSDPRNHHDRSFRYIVHAGPNVTNNGVDTVISFMQFVRNHDFNTEVFFSTSVVSEAQTATFNTFGVILSLPSEKIIAATSQDMRSTDANARSFEVGLGRFFETSGLPTPSSVLEHASHSTSFFNSDMSWTEVLAYGRIPSTNRTRVTGLFAHRDSLGEIILTESRRNTLAHAAEAMQIPLVLLPPPRGHFVLKVRMFGTRSAPMMQDYGPEKILFFGSEEQVRAVFRNAALHGSEVRLVDETGGPMSAMASEALFTGVWRDRWGTWVDGRPQSRLFSQQELPAAVQPIQFQFHP